MKQRESVGQLHSPADIRRKLEGRLEVVETAINAYSLLERLLREARWMRRPLPDMESRTQALVLLRQVRSLEPVLLEALATIHQRASLERWPRTVPAIRLAGRAEVLRVEVASRLGACLGDGGVSCIRLTEALERLERYSLEAFPPPPSQDEQVLLRADFAPGVKLPVLLSLSLPFAPAPFLPRIIESTDSIAWTWRIYGLAAVFWLLVTRWWIGLQKERSGRLWVTQRRLVWEPVRGAPVQLPLRSLVPGGARPYPTRGVAVRVQGGPDLILDSLGDTQRVVDRLNLISTWTGSSESLIQAVRELDERAAREAATYDPSF